LAQTTIAGTPFGNPSPPLRRCRDPAAAPPFQDPEERPKFHGFCSGGAIGVASLLRALYGEAGCAGASAMEEG
jgi:hypothetical protein